MSTSNGRERLLVALDVDSADRAVSLAEQLHGLVGGVKVGSRLFTTEGPALVRRLAGMHQRVFLDLKFHDIPNTVAQAVEAAVATGAWLINVHAAGGSAMMQAAVDAAGKASAKVGRESPLMIAVTVLTSMDEPSLRATGVERSLLDQVRALATAAQRAGMHGVVASPQETAIIRDACGPDFVIVTPGIRGAAAGTDKNDQARTMGPAEAVRAGSSYLVVGRPIIAAPEPRSAAEAIVRELESAELGE
jgi:orotidine-5'-phosphate decarboxylase